MSIKNRLHVALISVAVLLIVAVLGVTSWVRSSLPEFKGSLRVPGIEAPINIIRDINAVPHIFAARENDAYFALGFVHASDRMWQMDVMRRLGAGRLSEIFGEPALRTDKLMRTLGFYRLAAGSVDQLSPPVVQSLEAYAAGVNAWLSHSDQSLPPEFFALRYEPEPWKPADSLVWGKLMAWQLAGNMREELLRARLTNVLSAEAVNQLLPSGDDQTDAKSAAAIPPPGSDLAQNVAAELLDLLGSGPEKHWASNVWAIGPQKTATGGAILANDPHLGLSVPIPWYLARLESPKLAVRGATVPGVPYTILGQNRHIAWGVTNNGADVQDLLIIELNPEDEDTLVSPGGSVSLKTREETISVRGSDDVSLKIRETGYGPIVSDLLDSAEGLIDETQAIVLSFTALAAEDVTAGSIYAINHAADWPEVTQAVKDWLAPPVNLAYADNEGQTFLTVVGAVPIRDIGEGLIPRSVTGTQSPWREFIVQNELPLLHQNPNGWISNANEDPSPPGYEHWLGSSFEERFRKDRIDEQLAELIEEHSLKDSLAIQADTVSLAARELLPQMMAINPQDPAEADLFADLRTWNGSMDRDRYEPLVFAYWLRTLNEVLFADELGDEMNAYLSLRPTVVKSALEDHQGWCDNTETDALETCDDALRLSLRRTLLTLEERHGSDRTKWRWGKEHVASFGHPLFSRIPLLGWFGNLSLETDGGPFTVNRGNTPVRNDGAPFAHTHGAGYRAVYDLSDQDKSQFIIATGQSGNPLSEHYGSLVPFWRDGMAVPIAGSPEDLSQTGLGLFTLRPDID